MRNYQRVAIRQDVLTLLNSAINRGSPIIARRIVSLSETPAWPGRGPEDPEAIAFRSLRLCMADRVQRNLRQRVKECWSASEIILTFAAATLRSRLTSPKIAESISSQ